MATPFNIVINQALVTIEDYKLDALYKKDKAAFKQVLISYMLRELPKFTDCLKPLTYDKDAQVFDSDFDNTEIALIADYTVIAWYLDKIQDVLEFKEPLQDKAFKKYATGQNLKPRQEYVRLLREKVKQDGTNYQMQRFSSLPFFGEGGDING